MPAIDFSPAWGKELHVHAVQRAVHDPIRSYSFPEADIEAKPCSHVQERSGVNTNPTVADNGQGDPGTLTRANDCEMP